MSNEHTAPEFEFGWFRFVVQSDGAVRVTFEDAGGEEHPHTIFPDEFKQLVDAQQRTVWAAQHWTSLAAVSDALSSLLAVHAARVQLSGVYGQTDGKGHVTYYRADLFMLSDYRTRQVETTADAQALYRELNATPANASPE